MKMSCHQVKHAWVDNLKTFDIAATGKTIKNVLCLPVPDLDKERP